jgi:hypothetical protein
MTTLEGIVTALIVVGSFVGASVVLLVRRADRRAPLELDPRYDDPADPR